MSATTPRSAPAFGPYSPPESLPDGAYARRPAAAAGRRHAYSKRFAALFAALTYAISGVGFAGASILLARALTREEYALVSLALTFLFTGFSIAPLGADAIINRHGLPPSTALLRRLLGTSTVVAVAVAGVAWGWYGITVPVVAPLAVGIVAGGVLGGAAAQFQARRRFTASLALTQCGNILLLAAAAIALAVGARTARLPVALTAGGLLVAAGLGWRAIRRVAAAERQHGTSPGVSGPSGTYPWREALSCATASGAGLVLAQLERLVIPQVLELRDLAVYAVLASVALAPYRVLQLGAGHTLLPHLRGAATPAERRHILRREALTVLAAGTAGGLAIWLGTPVAVRILLAGKYVLPPTLILAAIAAGNIKVLTSVVRVAATAVCGLGELTRLGIAGWVAIAVGILASVAASPLGIVGVMAGVSLGWLAWLASALLLLRPALREPS